MREKSLNHCTPSKYASVLRRHTSVTFHQRFQVTKAFQFIFIFTFIFPNSCLTFSIDILVSSYFQQQLRSVILTRRITSSSVISAPLVAFYMASQIVTITTRAHNLAIFRLYWWFSFINTCCYLAYDRILSL